MHLAISYYTRCLFIALLQPFNFIPSASKHDKSRCSRISGGVAAASHLPPIPLALRGRRRHLGFLLAGFELLSGLYHLAGVVLTGGAVPVWRAAKQLCGSPAGPAPKTKKFTTTHRQVDGGSGDICILDRHAVKKLHPAEAAVNVFQLKKSKTCLPAACMVSSWGLCTSICLEMLTFTP